VPGPRHLGQRARAAVGCALRGGGRSAGAAEAGMVEAGAGRGCACGDGKVEASCWLALAGEERQLYARACEVLAL
jgi:hypothetical protein